MNRIQDQINSVCSEIADAILQRINDKIEQLQSAVRTLSTNSMNLVTSSLSDDLLQPVLDALSGAFLSAAPDQPLRGIVKSIITDPMEEFLQAAFEEMLQQALGDAVAPLVAGVSDALQTVTDNLGLGEEKIKAAIIASLQPQVLLVRSKLEALKASIDSRLAPV
ncbi:MAG: hypothetical protein ACK5YO_37400, partial [Planctomyces sp.]